MINPRVCSICTHGKVDMPVYDDDTGEKLTLWTVDCYLDKKNPIMWLRMVDEPPQKCPYILEHKISMSSLTKEDIDHAEGRGT